MKYSITYSRKVRTGAYEMLEIGLTMEFDDAYDEIDEAEKQVAGTVEIWIQKERDRILKNSVKRPEVSE